MEPIRVFYDDMYIYQEFSQPIEGGSAPLIIKIGIGTKPEYQKLASHIERLYEEMYKPKGGNKSSSSNSSLFQSGGGSSLLPPEYYAEHTIVISKSGSVCHLEYHTLPEPTLYVSLEIKKNPERLENEIISTAHLCDQSYLIGEQEYIVTSLKGNYADFPKYSPFFLDKTKFRTFVFDQKELAESGAHFTPSEKLQGKTIDTLLWFRERFAPSFIISHFIKD